jgi:hypothetical protein
MKPAVRLAVTAMMVLTVTCNFGCVKGDTSYSVRYDEKEDSFRVLFVFCQIRGHDAKELDWIATLFERRGNLIPTRFMEFLSLFDEPAYLRVSNSTAQRLDLSEPPNQAVPTKTTTVPLDTIKITPGQFFLGPDGGLCYDHALAIPGKAVDAFLAEHCERMCDVAMEAVPMEIRRRKDGGKRKSWDDFRESQIQLAAPNAIAEGTPPQLLECLEDESLRVLLAAAASRKIMIQRQKANLTVSVPLTEMDARQAAVAAEVFLEPYHSTRDGAAKGEGELDFFKSVKAQPEKDKVVFSGRLPAYLTINQGDLAGAHKLDAKEQVHLKNTVASMRGRGLPVNSQMTLRKRVEQFKAGK